MKKILTVLLLCLVVCLRTYAQADGSAYSIRMLRNQIETRDSVLKKDLKPRVMIDSLRSQVADYDSLTTSMEIRYNDMVEVIKMYEHLTNTDTLVFYHSFAQYDIPPCLKNHVELVGKITDLRIAIEKVELKIKDLKDRLEGLDVNFKSVIRKEIEDEVNNLDAGISEIEKLDMNSLSKEQLEFFKPGLTERYNNFLIYFE